MPGESVMKKTNRTTQLPGEFEAYAASYRSHKC